MALWSVLNWCHQLFIRASELLHVKHLAAGALCLILAYLSQYKPYYRLAPEWFAYGNWSINNGHVDQTCSWTAQYDQIEATIDDGAIIACAEWQSSSASVFLSAYRVPSKTARMATLGRLPLTKIQRVSRVRLHIHGADRLLALSLLDSKVKF